MCRLLSPSGPTHQLSMTVGVVGERGLALKFPVTANRADQALRIDIDTNAVHLFISEVRIKLLLGVPDLEY